MGFQAGPEIGLLVPGAGSGNDRFTRARDLAVEAEAAGFGGLWVGELYDRSAPIMMAALALATTRCTVGSSIAYGVGRSPVVWAAEARDLDDLSQGRLILGLGNGNARMMEAWHGVSGEAPAVRMEELVTVLRKLWRLDAGPVAHEGRFYRVDLTPPPGTAPPSRDHLPIYTAGVNPRMVETAGRVADGLLGHPMFTGRYIDEVVRPALAKGAERARRAVGDLRLVRVLMCSIDADLEVARGRLAFGIAQYAASRVFDRLFELHGWDAEQRAIREALRSRDPDAATAAVPAEAVDAIGVACRPGELAELLPGYVAGADHLTLSAPAWGLTPEQTVDMTRAIVAEIAGSDSRQ
jgi:alkanesulfonate monooxygenase SsuD/methylene tetrahydromethanopterin reductase-like flavin-dependent oxidoreductase (luciferase family)